MEALSWKTERRRVDALLPHPNNPRYMTERQVEALSESLRKFNLVELPVINTDNQILAGHQRLKIMQLLGRGQEEVEVRVPDRTLTPEEASEYLIRSNKNVGEWDLDVLMSSFDPELLMTIGFEKWELPEFPVTQGAQFDQVPVDVEEFADHRKAVEIVPVQKNVATCPNCGHNFPFYGNKNMHYGREKYSE